MELKASDIQKQRIKEIEEKADELVQKCSIMFVSSVKNRGRQNTLKPTKSQVSVSSMGAIL